MRVTMSVVIMAHPKRKEQVDAVLAKLDRKDVPVIWDEKNDRWDTGRRSMLAYNPNCTHHLVLQDDILVPRKLIAGFRRALEHTPGDVPVCGYYGRYRPHKELVLETALEAEAAKASFITMHTLNWGPAIAVPTDIIPEMIAYCDPLDIPNYDRRLSRYWELGRKMRIWYTWPSLVDHADGPSLIPGRMGTDRSERENTRVAHKFVGLEASALDVDWTGPVVDCKRTTAPTAPTAPAAPAVQRSKLRYPVRLAVDCVLDGVPYPKGKYVERTQALALKAAGQLTDPRII